MSASAARPRLRALTTGFVPQQAAGDGLIAGASSTLTFTKLI